MLTFIAGSAALIILRSKEIILNSILGSIANEFLKDCKDRAGVSY
jgi:hypothetical protein